MIILNPVHCSTLVPRATYQMNPQFLPRYSGPRRQEFIQRANCILEVTERNVLSGMPSKDYFTLTCTNATNRSLHKKHGDLKLYRIDLSPEGVDARGSLIVKLYSEYCHGCGHYNDTCWRDWAGHYLCVACRTSGKIYPPFAYGTGTFNCCDNYKCGANANKIGGAGVEKIYNQAVEIQTRYRACRQ